MCTSAIIIAQPVWHGLLLYMVWLVVGSGSCSGCSFKVLNNWALHHHCLVMYCNCVASWLMTGSRGERERGRERERESEREGGGGGRKRERGRGGWSVALYKHRAHLCLCCEKTNSLFLLTSQRRG